MSTLLTVALTLLCAAQIIGMLWAFRATSGLDQSWPARAFFTVFWPVLLLILAVGVE